MNARYLLVLLVMMVSLNTYGVQLVNMKVHVHEENGKPVEGAYVRGVFFQDQVVDKQMLGSHQGLTDSEGFVELSGHEELYVNLTAKKNTYYDSRKRITVRGGRGREVSILLRKKRNPIAMYAKKVINVSPDYDKAKLKQISKAGYDLIVGDYVAPYGDGVVSDLVFHTESARRSWNDFDLKRLITFSNKLDGLIPYYFDHKESVYKDPYLAPLEGYKNEWLQRFSRKPEESDQGNIDSNRNYFIRIRTKIDKEGKITYAHYGKIHGDFPRFTYYVNPTPNDRNIEFDPKQNLLKNLKHEEEVGTP